LEYNKKSTSFSRYKAVFALFQKEFNWIYNASNILVEGNTLLSINDYDNDGDNISISIKESIVETNLADRWMLMRMKMIGKDC